MASVLSIVFGAVSILISFLVGALVGLVLSKGKKHITLLTLYFICIGIMGYFFDTENTKLFGTLFSFFTGLLAGAIAQIIGGSES